MTSIYSPSIGNNFLAPAGEMEAGIITPASQSGQYVSTVEKTNQTLYELLAGQYTPATMMMTYVLAMVSHMYLPNRRLKLFYPGCGTHIAPLLIALELIERDCIDSATFYYADPLETNVEGIDTITSKFETIRRYVDDLAISKGEENDFIATFSYKGKKVELIFYMKEAEKVIEKLPRDLNLFFFHRYFISTASDILLPIWKQFFEHCSGLVTVFSYAIDINIMDVISDWDVYTEDKFTDIGSGYGVAFGIDTSVGGEVIEKVWNIAADKTLLLQNTLFPDDSFDRFISQNVLRYIDDKALSMMKHPMSQNNQRLVDTTKQFYGTYSLPLNKAVQLARELARNLSEDEMQQMKGNPTFLAIHANAIALRNMGIDLTQDIDVRITQSQYMLYAHKENLTFDERLLLIENILSLKRLVKPSVILDLCEDYPEAGFNALKTVFQYIDNAGYTAHVTNEVITRLEQFIPGKNRERLNRYLMICMWLSENKNAVEILLRNPSGKMILEVITSY